jgi:hypothetical protein
MPGASYLGVSETEQCQRLSDTRCAEIREVASYLGCVASCAFCRRPNVGTYAVTSLRGDPADASAWGRGTLALCQRCHDALQQAGEAGRVLKGTQQRWFLGHGVGKFESCGR